jgi:hypothetical protein
MNLGGARPLYLDEPLITTLRRPSLRSQLNQIRLWLRQGRTDAWIAHKLDISVDDLQQFKREHHLDGEQPPSLAPLTAGEPPPELEELEEEDEDEEEEEPVEEEPIAADDGDIDAGRPLEVEDEDDYEEDEDEDEDSDRGGAIRRRRRGRRGGRRRRSRKPVSFEGTFEHGDEGYGLWFDPAVADNDVYSEHWAGHREVTISIEPDAIIIRRAE